MQYTAEPLQVKQFELQPQHVWFELAPYCPGGHGLTQVLELVKYPVLPPEVLQALQYVELLQVKHLEGQATQVIPET